VEDFQANWSQRRRLEVYLQALERLREVGDVFACTCSRRTEGAFTEDGIYTGLCRNKHISFGQNDVAWRFHSGKCSNETIFTDIEHGIMRINTSAAMGDVVLRRKDGIPAYQIASLIDDELDGITFIVRGNDLLPSTAVQSVLAERLHLCGFPIHGFQQAKFLHHPLLLDSEQKKLSKSHGAVSLKVFREQGGTPHEIYCSVAEYFGIREPVPTLRELLATFEVFSENYREKIFVEKPVVV
jgi:glutamyl-tRNA synthetase